jgi:phage tail-like protein
VSIASALSGLTQIEDPLPAYNFLVTLEPGDAYLPAAQLLFLPSMASGAFAEEKGLGGELEVMPYAEGGVNDFVHQLPVRHSWGRITFRRGVIRDMALWLWYRAGLTQSLGARRDGTIFVLTEEGSMAVAYRFRGAIATKWMGPELSGLSSAVAMDGIEIAHHGIEAVPLIGPEELLSGVTRVLG